MTPRTLLRMQRELDLGPPRAIPGVTVSSYEPSRDHPRIPAVFSAAFARPPWPEDWDGFAEFDPAGVFVADDAEAGAVGFAICFQRDDFGYVSVVAVVPDHQRRGIASVLVRRAAEYMRSRGLATVRIDAWEDSVPAVAAYRSLGFTVYEEREEDDADSPERTTVGERPRPPDRC